MATDEWLRVEGCDNVYALGDCATINQRKVMVSVLVPFESLTVMCGSCLLSVIQIFLPINSIQYIMVFCCLNQMNTCLVL